MYLFVCLLLNSSSVNKLLNDLIYIFSYLFQHWWWWWLWATKCPCHNIYPTPSVTLRPLHPMYLCSPSSAIVVLFRVWLTWRNPMQEKGETHKAMPKHLQGGTSTPRMAEKGVKWHNRKGKDKRPDPLRFMHTQVPGPTFDTTASWSPLPLFQHFFSASHWQHQCPCCQDFTGWKEVLSAECWRLGTVTFS